MLHEWIEQRSLTPKPGRFGPAPGPDHEPEPEPTDTGSFEDLVARIRGQAADQPAAAVPEIGDDVIDAEWVREVGEAGEDGEGLELVASPRPAARPTVSPPGSARIPAPPATETEPPSPARRGPARLWLIVGGLALVALIAFVPLALLGLPFPPFGGDDTTPGAIALPGAPEIAAPADPAGTQTEDVQPGLEPPVTPLPTPAPGERGRLAFASDRSGNFEIYVREMATGQVMQLTANGHADRQPAWSPDGTRLVYVSNAAGDDDLYVMNADGSNVIQLTTGTAHDRTPVWSRDGLQVVFARETPDGSSLMAFDATCMDEPGACERSLRTLTSGGYDREPVYSPDGQMLAFSTASFPGLPSAVGLVPIAGGEVSALEGTGASDSAPAWSPDGVWLAFSSNRFGDADLWMMAPDGGGVAQLTRDTAVDVQPWWSPGGEFVVFASDRGGTFDLYRLDAACFSVPETCEDSLTALVEGPGDDLDPAWGP